MKIQEAQRDKIKSAFSKIQTKEDLLDLLNYTKYIIYGEKTIPFKLNHLNYHSNPKANKKRYTQFKIRKKSGGERIINSPNRGLKAIQKCLNLVFQTIYQVHPAAKGFVPQRSIVDNAKLHTRKLYVYNIDLKDFFPSIDQARIWGRLKHPPFNFNEKYNRLEIANVIASLCCNEMDVERLDNNKQWQTVVKNVLPQGAPTSPTISNIICQQLDFYLSAVSKRFGLDYTRYADDITFSSMHNEYQKNSDFLKELHRIVEQQGFNINESKTRLQKQGYRQEVTGLLVNEKVNVQKRYIKQLRMWLYYWENYGYERANQYFLPQYLENKSNLKDGKPNMANVIAGKIDYLKMVKGEENSNYLKLKERFEILSKNGFESSVILDQEIETKIISSGSDLIRLKIESIDRPNGKGQLINSKFLEKGIKIPYEEVFNNRHIQLDRKKVLIKHNPLFVMNFLKNFKYDNDTGLKDLVHKPFDNDSFDYKKILEKVRSHPNFNRGEKVKEFQGKLPIQIWIETNSLIEFLSTIGLDYYLKTGNHPIEDPIIAKKIQEFKCKYRFGSEKTEYSVLSDLINNIVKSKKLYHPDTEKNINYSFSELDTSGQFSANQIIFLPDDKKFAMRAGFFTWVHNVKNAVWWICEGILKHSNVNGNRAFSNDEKKIEISIVRQRDKEQDHTKVKLVICDSNSVLSKSPDSLINDLKGSEPYTLYLRSIADWSVECDYENKSYRLLMLPQEGVLEELHYPVNGFKHIITFYD